MSGLDCSVELRVGELALDVTLAVAAGETVAVVGPNGAGKSTLLRAVAGLIAIDRGRIDVDGVTVDDPDAGVWVPPERRPVALAFQDGLLFPHLSVLDNVAFGPRCRGASRRAARRCADECLARVGAGALASARPGTLSGGQAQRVALARALAVEPAVLLLDEPLAALDASTRVDVRQELRRQLAMQAGAHVLVTHDPLEASALADRLVVLERGHVVQTGTAADLAARPRSRYVADLVGVNLWRGVGHGDRIVLDTGGTLQVPGAGIGAVFAVVHPRAVSLHRARPEGSPRNVWEGRVEVLDDEGDRVRVRVGGPVPLVSEVTPAAVAELALGPGAPVWCAVKASEVVVTADHA